MIQKVTYNAIILCLSVSALAVWGTLSQVGISTAAHCGEYSDGNIGIIITLLVVVGGTLAGYGVAVKQDTAEDGSDLRKGYYQFALIAGHVVALFCASMLIDHHFDDDLNCQTFTGRQNFFLYVLIAFISLSGVMLLYSIVLAWQMHNNKDLDKARQNLAIAQEAVQMLLARAEKKGNALKIFYGFCYVGITFLFFFYATAPAGDVSSFKDSHMHYTLGAVGIVLVLYLLSLYRADDRSEDDATYEKLDPGIFTCKATHQTWWAVSQLVVAVVVTVNIGLSIAIIEDDLKVVQRDGHIGNGTTACFDQNEQVLDMNMTAIGFWALYIIILSGALVQTVYRIGTPVKNIKFNAAWGKLYYSDTYHSLDMPTVWIVFTGIWVMAASITHHGDYTSDNCKFTHEKELCIMILHSIGSAVVLVVLPWVYGWLARKGSQSNDGERANITILEQSNSKLRPTNRFTTKSQVAVDVNTPLNFA